MSKLDGFLKDGLCPLMPIWNTMLILEFTFISLLAISLFLSPGQPSVAIYFSLLLIIPTTAMLLGLIYYCKRQEEPDPFRREASPSNEEDGDLSPGEDGNTSHED